MELLGYKGRAGDGPKAWAVSSQPLAAGWCHLEARGPVRRQGLSPGGGSGEQTLAKAGSVTQAQLLQLSKKWHYVSPE